MWKFCGKLPQEIRLIDGIFCSALDPYFLVKKDRIEDSPLARENTGQRKPVFWHMINSVFSAFFHKNNGFKVNWPGKWQKMVKHTIKFLWCSQHETLWVCLTIFQHYAWNDLVFLKFNIIFKKSWVSRSKEVPKVSK